MFKNIFFILLIKSGLLLSAASAQQESNTNRSDLILFLQSPVSFLHLVNIPTSDLPSPSNGRLTNLALKSQIYINSIDYHPRTKTFYFTNPRVGYWTRNAQLYSIPWDPDFVCTTAKAKLREIELKLIDEAAKKKKQADEDDDDIKSESKENDNEEDDNEDSEKKAVKDEVKRLVSTVMLGKPVCLVDDKKNNTVIFHKQTSDSTKLLYEKENWNPRSIAVDYIGDKLYIVDTGDAAVSVYDLDGRNKALVFRNESTIPLEVAIDVNKGLMFVLAYNTKLGTTQVYRANMDGSSPLLIAEHKEELEDTILRDKIGFALNTMKKRVYFANRGKKMYESVDYDGNGRVKIGEANPPLGITAYNDTVFWSDGGTSVTDSFLCIRNKCSIMACRIDTDGSCINNSTTVFDEGKLIAAYNIKSMILHPKINSNPCAIDNGGCEHHCLLKQSSVDGGLDRGCICREGYRLTENLKNCTKIKVTDIYDDFYLQNPMNLSSLSNLSSENIYPISRNLLYRLKYERPNSVFVQPPFLFVEIEEDGKRLSENELFEKDSMTSDRGQDEVIGLLGLGAVARHKCRMTINPSLVFSPNFLLAQVVSYDWIAKNIYYVKLSNSSNEQHDLMVIRFELPGRICVDDQKDTSHYLSQHIVSIAKIPEPASLEVHPYKGYIFASLRNGSLIRLNTDGSNKIDFPNVNNSVMLAMDLSDDKVYWLDSDGYVNYANLDGSNPKQLFKSPVNQTKTGTIKIFGDWVYITETLGHSYYWIEKLKLWRFDKLTGKESGTLNYFHEEGQLYRESLGFKVRGKDAKYVNTEDNPCAVSNGGCESICFAVPTEKGSGELRKVCACGSKQLQDNNNCELLKDQWPKNEAEEYDDEI